MSGRIELALRRNRRLIVLAVYAALVPAAWMVLSRCPPLKVRVMDFIIYWSAARIYLAGGNPYDPAQMATVQQALGPVSPTMITFWYTPWTIPLFLPLGWFSYPTAFVVWFLLLLAATLVAGYALWLAFGGPLRRSWPALAIAIVFAPLAMALLIGQITPLLLFGLAGFLYCESRRRDVLAGCALALVATKPQLLYLFWVALLFWLVGTRRWRVALGALLPVAAGCLAVGLTNPRVLLAYLGTVNYAAYSMPPTLVTVLGLPRWVSVAMPCLAVLWFVWYWRRHGATWRWQRELPLLVILSLATTPVIWVADLVLLLLPLMAIMARLSARPRALAAALGSYLLLNAAMWYVVLKMPGRHERFVWVPLACLLLYLAARRTAGLRLEPPSVLAPDARGVTGTVPGARAQ